MNLVLVHTHDTGRHLGCYGAPVATPNLSRLAAGGILFRKAFCASPNCSPSRASLMTGRMPHNHGLVGLAHRGFRMNDVGEHLSHRLRRAGFRTQLIGLQHEVAAEEVGTLGYDGVISRGALARHSGARGRVAAEWLSAKPPEPFFLNVGFAETHRAFGPLEPPEDERYVSTLPWLPDDPEVRLDVAELQTAVRHVDEGVGAILDALDRTGLAGRTLVIFTTDHGVPFPRAKATLFDAGIGVALVARGPGGFEGGRVIDSLASQIDVLPTLFELFALPLPPGVQGVSLLPMVRGEVPRVRAEVFAELTFHAAYDPMRCARTERHKFIRHFVDRPRMFLANVDEGPSKRTLAKAGLPAWERPREMLFDLAADPLEFENLAARPEFAAIRADLSSRLQAWMEATDDPLLRGDVAPPPGAVVTPPDAAAPHGSGPAYGPPLE